MELSWKQHGKRHSAAISAHSLCPHRSRNKDIVPSPCPPRTPSIFAKASVYINPSPNPLFLPIIAKPPNHTAGCLISHPPILPFHN